MDKNTFIQLATIVFAIVGVIHLYRGFVGLPLTLGNWKAPLYISFVESFLFFLFAYLGRRNVRFIKNEAGIVPLTGFLCIYPHSNDEKYIERLWEILQHPDTISNLQLVGKSYGSGAIKVEPRSLERLPINSNLVEKLNLKPIRTELSLFA